MANAQTAAPAAGTRRRSRRIEPSHIAAGILGGAVFVFLALPIVVITFSAFSPSAFPEFPPTGFSLQWFNEVFTSRGWMRAIQTSLVLLCIVTPLTVVLGTLASYALHSTKSKAASLLQSFLLSPLMMPQIVLGIALLYVFSSLGLAGSLAGMAIGQAVICLPYVVRCVNASIASFDPCLEAASMSLGASPAQTFRRVTLPLIKPGIIAGAVFAAVTSLGEVSISLFLSSPKAMPVSVRVFNYIEQTFDPAVTAVSVIFVVVSIAVLIVIDRTVGLSKVM